MQGMQDEIRQIALHLQEKGKYSNAYIDHVSSYLGRNPDLAHEFYITLPKNTLLDSYINVDGYSIRELGARTMLSRSAIYVVLCRLREDGSSIDMLIKEEGENMFRL